MNSDSRDASTRFGLALFTSPGLFGTVVLKSLLHAGCSVSLIVIPGPSPRARPEHPVIPLLQADSLPDLAASAGIPVRPYGTTGGADATAVVAARQPDMAAVACFPHILPPPLLDIPRHGCFNVHPSLLPAYRGPVPLFWQFRAGERRVGATLHCMTEQVDAGEIVAQEAVVLPAGLSEAEATDRLARAGSELLTAVVAQLRAGRQLKGRVQDEHRSSYFSWPEEQDFRVPTDWPAERAFRFLRGTEPWGHPYEIRLERKILRLRSATAYSPAERLGRSYAVRNGEVLVQFSPGVLTGVLWEGS